MARFRADTFTAISEQISLNPVLHAFQLCVNKYGIDHALINAFLDSMAMDLDQNRYDESGYKQYIFGSAEAVGLMCLHVFCEGDMETYSRLESSAKSLGAAFQKVNFLRDIRSDFDDRGRVYFPATDFNTFDAAAKACVEADIKADFEAARIGILQLPAGARSGVWLAYAYYCRLFRRIAKLPASEVLTKRIRVPDSEKLAILVQNWCLSPFRYAR